MKNDNLLITSFVGVLLLIIGCTHNGDIDAVGLQGNLDANESHKVDVCHNDHIINISVNAVEAHQDHGDAFDLDGDGYFDIENSCGPVDCDDTDPTITSNPDGSCDPGTVAELLVGTWVTTNIELEAMVGALTLLEYLTDVVGLSAEDAADRIAVFEAFIISELDVTLTLNDDGTYASTFAGGSDSGTWSLSADGTTITMLEGADTIIATIVSVSETTLVAILADTIPFDLDGDAGTPDENIDAQATVTFTRS